MKKQRTRFTDIKITIDYGEYLIGYSYQVEIGNSMISANIKFPVKPTAKQLRKLKKAWYSEMREYDFKALHYKKYSIKKGRFLAIL